MEVMAGIVQALDRITDRAAIRFTRETLSRLGRLYPDEPADEGDTRGDYRTGHPDAGTYLSYQFRGLRGGDKEGGVPYPPETGILRRVLESDASHNPPVPDDNGVYCGSIRTSSL